MTMAPGAAVFLERDGVLIRDVHHLCRVEQIELLSGVAEALRYCAAKGLNWWW
jgi:histidinol phosphatase-like enzyme